MSRLTQLAIGAAVGAGGLYAYVQWLQSAALAAQPKGNPSLSPTATQYSGYVSQLAMFGITSLPTVAQMQSAYNAAQP